MKFRIDQNRIIFRLSPAQWHQLLETGKIHEKTGLPGGMTLQYRVETAQKGAETGFCFQDNIFTFTLPRHLLEQHDKDLPSRAGICHEFILEDGEKLNLSLQVDMKKGRKD